MILVRNGIIASSFNGVITTQLWDESNWSLTTEGTSNGGVWEDSTTLAFNSYSGNANTPLFEYTTNGVPESVGMSLRITIEFDPNESGEVVMRVFNVDGGSASPDSYFFPSSPTEPLTVTSEPVPNSDIKSVALFNSFGAFLPFKVINVELV